MKEVSQIRKYTTFTVFHYFRIFFWRYMKGVRLGKSVWLDCNVHFLRFYSGIKIGNNVIIKEGARICSCNSSSRIVVGNNTTIGYNTFIFSSCSILIGNDCLIAPYVYIVDSNHKTDRRFRINEQKNILGKIFIGNDVWIASNVTVLMNVTIGEGAVVAANSVVNSDIPPYEIWGGTPARKIGERI